jgi:single-strand selective monofunctional uracil DNA glycosylase
VSTSPLVLISRDLGREVGKLRFRAPVTHVYNPLDYARAAHEAYVERWGAGRKEAVLLGMNPGPFGMAQTGVPFGDVALVRDFLGVTARVKKPPAEHPARPVLGFDCTRGEVSGQRLWGFARDTFGTPERFFARFFVVNYCPLAFMEESGKNRTPDKLPRDEQLPLFEACDRALVRTIDALAPAHVIGVGAFAKDRAERALGGRSCQIGTILHPSPASPLANRGWGDSVRKKLADLGIKLP